MKIGVIIGVVTVLTGLALMITGKQLCRGSCWADDVFRYLLPLQYESLAGGLPWLLIGLAIIGWGIFRRRRWSAKR